MIYLSLFYEFFIIGLFTFGGGYAMIPLIQQTVLENGWLTETQIIDFIAVSESTPGPLAVNMSTFVGMKTAGLLGAFMATTGVVLPSFIIIYFISGNYYKFQNNRIVKGAMSGLKPAVVALIAYSFLSVFFQIFQTDKIFPIFSNLNEIIITKNDIISIVTVVISIILIIKKKHPILVIGTGALIGLFLGFVL